MSLAPLPTPAAAAELTALAAEIAIDQPGLTLEQRMHAALDLILELEIYAQGWDAQALDLDAVAQSWDTHAAAAGNPAALGR